MMKSVTSIKLNTKEEFFCLTVKEHVEGIILPFWGILVKSSEEQFLFMRDIRKVLKCEAIVNKGIVLVAEPVTNCQEKYLHRNR